MENITAKLSYLQGLMDGLDLDKDSKEAKIFGAIAEVLEEMNDAIDDLYDYQDEMNERIELIDEDLEAVEDVLIDEDCDCDCDCDDCDCEDFEYEIDCPNCGETLVSMRISSTKKNSFAPTAAKHLILVAIVMIAIANN